MKTFVYTLIITLLYNIIMVICRTPVLQIVDGNGNFNTELSNFINNKCKFQFDENDKKIFVISIIGSQNSGSSSLLNNVYDTNFSVMSKNAQGIKISPVENSNILLLNNEGFDDSRNTPNIYEKKLALFSIASSNIIIFNIMEKDINEQFGDIISKFGMIFEDIAKINAKQETTQPINKKLLLFVINDFTDKTSLEEIRRKLKKHFKRIYKKARPVGFNRKFKDFFELECESLLRMPGKKPDETDNNYSDKLFLWNLKKEVYNNEINKLKNRLHSFTLDSTDFENKHNNKLVDYNDFPNYAKNKWETTNEFINEIQKDQHKEEL